MVNFCRACCALSTEEGRSQCLQSLSRVYSFRDHRKVLFVVNLLIALASGILAVFAGYLSIVMYDDVYFTVWIGWLGLSFLGTTLMIVCIVGMRGAYLVSLDLLLTYFWGIIVFVGPLLLGVVACMDFYTYMTVWFTHQWELPNFWGIHDIFCGKYSSFDETAEQGILKCRAPLQGTEAWCIENFDGDTNCSEVRENAIAEAVLWGENLTLVQGIVCIADLVLIGWCLFLCYRIMKEQVIVKSMNDVINYLLLLPIAACAGLSYYMWWLRDYDVDNLQYSWVAEGFAYIAGMQAIALPLGIIAGKMKSRSALSVYIILVICIIGALSTNGAYAIIYAGILPEIFQPSLSQIYDIACGKELTGCSGCEDTEPTCVEWSQDEVLELIVLDLKISGIIAFASAIYLIGALIVSFLVRRNLANYKFEYVGVGKPATLDTNHHSNHHFRSDNANHGHHDDHFGVSGGGFFASTSTEPNGTASKITPTFQSIGSLFNSASSTGVSSLTANTNGGYNFDAEEANGVELEDVFKREEAHPAKRRGTGQGMERVIRKMSTNSSSGSGGNKKPGTVGRSMSPSNDLILDHEKIAAYASSSEDDSSMSDDFSEASSSDDNNNNRGGYDLPMRASLVNEF